MVGDYGAWLFPSKALVGHDIYSGGLSKAIFVPVRLFHVIIIGKPRYDLTLIPDLLYIYSVQTRIYGCRGIYLLIY